MRVTVGVSGGIAAYKAAELVRALQRQALEIHVVMTAAACKFIQPLTFASLTGHKVITSLWDEWDSAEATPEQNGIEHIGEAQWAEALVVAPATANVLAKFAHGIADDFLTTMFLATRAPVLVAPAMNVNMWDHPATQANLELLRQRGVRVIDPGTGSLACGMVGAGRMAEPEAIADAVLGALGRRHDLAGEVVLVTAGGTREPLDPVRFLGNRSSGKMGYALAEAAQSRGAKVILVSAPSALYPPAHCELVKVTTADEMRDAVLSRMPEATLVIKSAAVADYRPVQCAAQKIKKTSDTLGLEMTRTVDILAQVSASNPRPFVVGFAAETNSVEQHARAKLMAKNLDMIAANEVGHTKAFDCDENALLVLWRGGGRVELPTASKAELAHALTGLIAERFLEQVHEPRQTHDAVPLKAR